MRVLIRILKKMAKCCAIHAISIRSSCSQIICSLIQEFLQSDYLFLGSGVPAVRLSVPWFGSSCSQIICSLVREFLQSDYMFLGSGVPAVRLSVPWFGSSCSQIICSLVREFLQSDYLFLGSVKCGVNIRHGF